MEKRQGDLTRKNDRKLLHGKEMEKSDMEKRQKDLTYKKTGRFDKEQRLENLMWERDRGLTWKKDRKICLEKKD